MTHLRKMMLEELQRRNYAESTRDCYIRTVEDFSRHFHCSPDRLGPRHIREYQSELFRKRKLAASTVTVYLAALRFFYTKTLKKGWSAAETPYPKRAEHVPSIRNGSLPWSSGGSPLETGRSEERENQKPSRSSRPFVHRFVWRGSEGRLNTILQAPPGVQRGSTP